jgi:exopolysaccharide production protein ExoQ
MIRYLCFLAFFVLFFSNLPGLSTYFQIIGVSLLMLAAIVSMVTRRARLEKLSLVEVLWFWATFFSFVVSLISGNVFVFLMTLVGSVAFTSVAILRRTVAFEELAEICAYSFCLITPIVIFSDLSGYLSGISAESAAGIGLLRFRPLGLHPNLAGFIFGFGAILNFYFYIKKSGFQRYIFFIVALMCVSFVLAASSRAGLFAILGAVVIAGFFRFRFRFSAVHVRILIFGLFLLPVLIYKFEDGSNYIYNVLELGSDTRGVDSGGTGRVDLWKLSVSEIENRNFFKLLFGSGFRSSSEEQIGYSTESSYFTLILENGLIVTAFFFFICLFSAGLMIRRARSVKDVGFLIGVLVVFVFLQSVFNRYMVAFGNPVSLLILFAYFGLGVFENKNNSL